MDYVVTTLPYPNHFQQDPTQFIIDKYGVRTIISNNLTYILTKNPNLFGFLES